MLAQEVAFGSNTTLLPIHIRSMAKTELMQNDLQMHSTVNKILETTF